MKSCSESCYIKIVNIFLHACGSILFFCIKISMSLSNTTYTSKPRLTRFPLGRIRFNTNYNLQPCPPIACQNFDLT